MVQNMSKSVYVYMNKSGVYFVFCVCENCDNTYLIGLAEKSFAQG